MSETTLNIIIGALIGFIPSVLIAYFGYRFQMSQKKRERKCEIVEQRITKIETSLLDAMKWINTIWLYSTTDKRGNDLESHYFTQEELLNVVCPLALDAEILRDENLIRLTEDFTNSFIEYQEKVLMLYKQAKGDGSRKVDYETEFIHSNFTKQYVEICMRLDYLREKI